MTSRVPGIVSIVFLVASAAFIVLNLVTDRSSFWAVWVIWAMGMVAGGVIGMFRLAPHRLLGLWLGAGIIMQLGLFLIDVGDSNPWWFFWPLGAWVVGAMAIAGLTVNLLESVPTSSPFIEVDGEPVRTGVAGATSVSSGLAGASRQPAESAPH
jgi:hypothetical protein